MTSDGCSFGHDRCQYSHNTRWLRRCPFYLSDLDSLRYLPTMCPDRDPVTENCPRRHTCPFAHTQEEINYHPLVYKTKICAKFKEGECRAYYCYQAHLQSEIRTVPVYNLPYTRGVDIPPMQNVIVTAKTLRASKPSSESPPEMTPTVTMRSPQNNNIPANPNSWMPYSDSFNNDECFVSSPYPHSPFPGTFDMFAMMSPSIPSNPSFIKRSLHLDRTPASANFPQWGQPLSSDGITSLDDGRLYCTSPSYHAPNGLASPYPQLSTGSIEPVPINDEIFPDADDASRFPMLLSENFTSSSPPESPIELLPSLERTAQLLEQSAAVLSTCKDSLASEGEIRSNYGSEKERVRKLLARSLDLQKDVLEMLS